MIQFTKPALRPWRVKRSLVMLIIGGIGCLPLAFADDTRTDPPRRPIPDAAAQKDSFKAVGDVFKDQLSKAKTPAAKRALAKKLLATGTETQNNSAEKYVLLKMSIDLAAQSHDSETALAAFRALGSSFDVDGIKATGDMLSTMAKSARSGNEQQEFVTNVESFIDDAVAADRYEVARQVADAALASVKRNSDHILTRELSNRQRDLSEIEAAYVKARKAEAILKETPMDPDANLTIGRFLCLVKGEWDTGLTHLSSGNDPALKALALSDLALPTKGNEQLAIADGWWNWAEKQSGRIQAEARRRSARWYSEAAPNLNGLDKAKAEQRVSAVPSLGAKTIVVVAANKEWQRAMSVRKGQVVAITAEGTWCFAIAERNTYTVDADGKPNQFTNDFIPNSNQGALIGQVGSQRFVIGRDARIRIASDGDLELRINDSGLFDNDGELTVTISARFH